MKKLFRKLHLWLSVPFGVVITLICFSGAMLVFEREIVQWSNPRLYQVQSVSSRALPMDEIMARAQNALPGDVKIQGVTIYPDPSRTYQLSLSKPHKASLFIDQYTGEIKGIYTRHTFFSTMFRLHRWLLGSRPEGDGIFWGKIVVGTSTLLFAIILISGVAIWWPRSVKGLKNSLRINFNRGFASCCTACTWPAAYTRYCYSWLWHLPGSRGLLAGTEQPFIKHLELNRSNIVAEAGQTKPLKMQIMKTGKRYMKIWRHPTLAI